MDQTTINTLIPAIFHLEIERIAAIAFPVSDTFFRPNQTGPDALVSLALRTFDSCLFDKSSGFPLMLTAYTESYTGAGWFD